MAHTAHQTKPQLVDHITATVIRSSTQNVVCMNNRAQSLSVMLNQKKLDCIEKVSEQKLVGQRVVGQARHWMGVGVES